MENRTVEKSLHPSRSTFVPPERLEGWVVRFGEAHGGLEVNAHDDGVALTCADGASAGLLPPWPADGRPGIGASSLERLAHRSQQSRSVGVLLIRRGGYAVGVAQNGTLLAHKCGKRNVSGRTATGGLMSTAAGYAATVFAAYRLDYVVLGGDKTLAQQVVAEPELAAYLRIPRLPLLDVPDPRLRVLEQAARDVRSVRVKVWDPQVY